VNSLIKPSRGVSVKTDPVQLLGCIKAPGRHCQTSASRTELIEQHIDAMLQQDVTDPEADDMDLVLSVNNISNDSQPEKAIRMTYRFSTLLSLEMVVLGSVAD